MEITGNFTTQASVIERHLEPELQSFTRQVIQAHDGSPVILIPTTKLANLSFFAVDLPESLMKSLRVKEADEITVKCELDASNHKLVVTAAKTESHPEWAMA